MEAVMDELKAQRAALARTVAGLYDSEAFPGSRSWMRYAKAEQELMAFDAAHPEVIKAIQAAHDAKVEAASIPAGGR